MDYPSTWPQTSTCKKVCTIHAPCFSRGPYWCLWSVMPLEAMLTSMALVHAAARGHVTVSGLYSHRRPCWYLWSVVPPKAMKISLVFVSAWSNIEACGTHYYQGPCYIHSPCCSWSLFDAHGLYPCRRPCGPHCHQSLCGCLWPLLLLEPMVMSMALVHASFEGLLDVYSLCPFLHKIMLMTCYLLTLSWCLCCALVQCWSLSSALKLETVLMSVVSAEARGHVDVRGPCCYQEPCESP